MLKIFTKIKGTGRLTGTNAFLLKS